MRWWQGFWQLITRPIHEITDVNEQQKAALFSAMLFGVMFLLAFATIIFSFSTNDEMIYRTYRLLGVGVCFVFYLLSRMRYYKWVARTFVIIALGIIFYVGFYVVTDAPESALSYALFPIMIAALVLSIRETIFILVLAEIVIFFVVLQTNFDLVPLNIAFVIFGISSLTLVFVNLSEAYLWQASESEARYRALMDANTEGIMVVDAQDAHILDANPALMKLLGYQNKDIIGRYPVEFVPKHVKSQVWRLWEGREQHTPYEIEINHQAGYPVYVDVTLKPYSYRQKPAYVLTLIDATARKQAETLLLESEKRFRAIFNHSSQQIGVLGRDGLVLEINDTTAKDLGIQSHEIFGKRLWDIKQLADSPAAKELLKNWVKRAANGEVIQEEITARNVLGEDVYLDLSLKPVLDDDSQVTMLIAESRDITAQRQAEQKRIESELRYQALFNHSVDAVFIIDLDGTIVTANQHSLAMLRCELEDIIGKPAQTYITQEEHHAMVSKLNQLKTGQGIEGVYERGMRRKDGTTFQAEVTAMMVYDSQGEPLYIQSLVRDITERKQVEAERLRLLNAIESSLNEIYIFDADSLKFEFVNTGAKRNLGYSMAELRNMTPLDIKPLFTAEKFAVLVDPLVQHQQEKIIFETIHRRKDSTDYSVEVNLQLIEFGIERTFLAIISDITERKRLEQEKFEVRIEQERTRVLQGFIEQASHHFRTPITNIKTSMYVLPRVQDKPEKYQHHMNALNRETERLTRLIEDLLLMLRLQKNHTEYEIEAISINQLLSEIRTVQEGQACYEDYQWTWALPKEDCIVIGDRQFLSRALLNIIDNAVSYSRKGDKISINAFNDNTWVTIEIEDTGNGISAEDLPCVFDEFFRSYESMEQDSTKSGLGLTIAQYIIRRHRGTISLQSEIKKGTHCQVVLPLNLEWELDAPTLPEKPL